MPTEFLPCRVNPYIDRQQITEFAKTIMSDVLDATHNVVLMYIQLHVLNSFLGAKWIDKHLDPKNSRSNFFRFNCKVSEDQTYVGQSRIYMLAEMILNLSHIPGFSSVCKRMMDASNVEPTYAEFEVGAMLHRNGIPFRFVEACGVKGLDYDIEFIRGGLKYCADAKCKLETTRQSIPTLYNLLRRASRQMPRDAPGVVFVKIPQNWVKAGTLIPEVNTLQVAHDFLRNTNSGVVSIIFYVSAIFNEEQNHERIQFKLICTKKEDKFSVGDFGEAFSPGARSNQTWFDIGRFIGDVTMSPAQLLQQQADDAIREASDRRAMKLFSQLTSK